MWMQGVRRTPAFSQCKNMISDKKQEPDSFDQTPASSQNAVMDQSRVIADA